MAPKKKIKKKTTSKKTVFKKAAAMKAQKRPKRLTKTKAAPKKAKKKASRKKQTRAKREYLSTQAFSPDVLGSRSSKQSGDLQDVPRLEDADSESVEELLEEGNTLEAGAVLGVEEADSHDEKEVRTREVPEDDVPSEYLDKE